MEEQSASVLVFAFLQVIIFHCLLLGAAAKFSGCFQMGDSLVDSGNNNNLRTTYAKANYPPYGLDFPANVPRGRFTNERLIADFILSQMGLPSPKPYLSPARNNTEGVNFASAGCGLFDSTGNVFRLFPSKSYPRPMPLQVDNFIQVKKELIADMGEAAALNHINKALFYMTFGINDIANNYYLPNSPLQEQYTISEFIDLLLMIYDKQLQRLIREGARKFVIVSLFPPGCSPLFLINNKITEPGECYEVLNSAAKEFNCRLEYLVSNLTQRFPNVTLLYANSYDTPLDMVKNPEAYGFTVRNVGCCNFIGPGPRDNRFVPLCLPASPTCANRSQYVYWDQVHPTSKTYSIIADKFWRGSTEDIKPMNIKQLAAM